VSRGVLSLMGNAIHLVVDWGLEVEMLWVWWEFWWFGLLDCVSYDELIDVLDGSSMKKMVGIVAIDIESRRDGGPVTLDENVIGADES
jgi:hypothetical protein